MQIEVLSGSLEQLTELTTEQGVRLVAAAAGPKMQECGEQGAVAPGLVSDLGDLRVALVLGSEGQGLTEALESLCTPVSIPMSEHVDSLNVGVAGSMLMLVLSSALQPVLSSMHTQLCASK